MRYPERARLSILLTSAIMVILGAAFVWLQVATPSDGARLEPGQRAWRREGVVVAPLRAQPAGLRAGDVVVAVDGVRMESWAQALLDPTAARPHWRFGQTLTYSVLRDGAPLDVPVMLGTYPLDTFWRESWSTIVFALVFALIALYTVVRRPSELAPLVLLLFASSILAGTTWSFGLQVSNLVGAAGFWLYTVTSSVCYLLFYIAALHFALIFPRSHPLLAGRGWRLWALYATPYALLAAYIAAMRRGTSNTLEWWGSWGSGQSVLVVVLLASTVAALVWGYRVHRDPETRKQVRWIVFGLLFSCIAGLTLWYIPGAVLGHSLISANALGLLLAFAARLPWRTIGLTALLPVLVGLQSLCIAFWHAGLPSLAALHVINGLAIFALTGLLALRSRRYVAVRAPNSAAVGVPAQ
jgi:two-component system NarL family sensor kinase